MNPKVINPYSTLGSKQKEKLDYVIANLPPNPTFDDLNAVIAGDIFEPNPENPNQDALMQSFLKTILPHAYNGYVNPGSPQTAVNGQQLTVDGGLWSAYNPAQLRIIAQMLHGINSVPAESIGQYLSDIEEEIVSGSGDAMHRVLTYEEQVPLFIATAIGKSTHEYWMAQIALPTGWVVYLNADAAINYAHLAGWVSAAMQGALLVYGLVKPPQIQVLDIFTSTIGAGKVVFKWIGR